MKYPIGIQTFEQIRDGGFVYVDKTDLIYNLVHEGKIYFLSRPRRFGKSLLVSTLKCYFEGKKEYFQGLKIEGLETEWRQYPIFHIDFNGQNFTDGEELVRTITYNVELWEAKWGKSQLASSLGDRFAYVLHQAHEQTGLGCVVLVDEYDKPLLDVMDMPDTILVNGVEKKLEDNNREILKGFYSVFKLADADLRFVLLTGVTKFSQITVFSGFNQPDDISMSQRFDSICGITEQEVEEYFAQSIHDMGLSLGYDDEEMRRELKKQYDGYHFSSRLNGVFNPFSLLSAFQNKEIQDYWFRTGTPTYLVRLLAHAHENLNEITGQYYDASQFVDYKAAVERPLPMIYQSGYLTIKAYERDDRTFLLDFPNNEVKRGFLTMVSADYFKSSEDPTSVVIQIQRCLKQGKTDRLRDVLASFLASIPYSARRHENEREKERYFQYTVYLLMRMVSCYTVYHEKETSQGRADCVVETPNYVYIFEYKLDRPAAEALAQIDGKGYAREYAADKRKVYKIACCLSSETGTVSEFEVRESNCHA